MNMKKELAPALGLIVALVAFLGSTLVASAISNGADDAHPPHAGGPITAHEVVASGTGEETGPWELVASRDANGEPCLGLRYTAETPGGVGGLAEACGPATDNQVGTLSFPASQGRKALTLFFGRVRSDAATARMGSGNAVSLTARAAAGKDGKSYVVAEHPGKVADAQVRLADGRGADLGRVDPAAVARNP